MLMRPQNLPWRVQEVRDRVARAALSAGRSAQSVTLLAVGKAQPLELVAAAAGCGVTDFGENYLSEALERIAALQNPALTWHFIGRIQSNKTRPIAEHFAWVHALDRLSVAERLSAQRPFHAPPLNVCLQVNLDAEASKGGVAPQEVPALAGALAALPRLRLRGLMYIPPLDADMDAQRRRFAELAALLARLNATGAGLDTLSMGMSADLEPAICAGATIVRVGTALFGART